ncbi:MAG TPA: nicotinate-nucleotide--dimethylbenzimidazole phosphoribosyltransferase, partial [Actinomycetota bacterium]|nr:nicotinate-nucleotide--dimethylbenzimidazole phosphoribosyltransferase [Actinomycetota bacterium]
MSRGDLLDGTIAAIPSPDLAVAAETARLLDAKTKPPGSLGRLEDLACRVAAIRGSVPREPVEPAIVVAAADHGVAARGVSAYPQEVTAQMLANFAGGGAAISVLAREAGARLVVVDAGVIGGASVDGVRSEIVDGVRGTDDLTIGPAMTRSTAVGLIERGIALAGEVADEGIGIVGLGEMGIANTTSASALAAALLPAEPSAVCGPGTGIDDEGLARKVDAVSRGLAMASLARDPDPVGVLAAVGGLEIAFLVGVTVGAAARRVPVLTDGFITSAAGLV